MSFRLGLTRDLLTPAGEPSFGAGALEVLGRNPAIEWEYLPEQVSLITPEIMACYDGLYVNSPRVTAEAVARDDCRVRIVARHGVGFDSVDVKALAARGILTTNTPIAVRRPVAVAALTQVFALAGRLFEKDRLTRAGRWNERTAHMGLGLTTRTLGVIGAGGIGKEFLRMARPFGWRMLATDPNVDATTIEGLGASRVALDALLEQSDFVVVMCLLDEGTRHLMNAEGFARMKKSAFFVNIARGPVTDEAALIDALRRGVIAGAAIDVFEQEPVVPDNPLLSMDNVIVTPHALCWTDECFDHIAREGLGCVVDFSLGKRPASVVPA